MKIQLERIGQMVVSTAFGTESVYCMIGEMYEDRVLVHTMYLCTKYIQLCDVVDFNYVRPTIDDKRRLGNMRKKYIEDIAK